ncbi:MAG: hypothetical protein JWO63_869, partial [Frankiales bacterium]|nr:hypothetical protein [Frankiales bacterium]
MAEDLSRWLRSLRPGTAADEPGWITGPQATETLEKIHARLSATQTVRRSR